MNSGTTGQLAWYGSTGTAVNGNANITATNGVLSLGQAGSAIGGLNLSGNTSGTVNINPQAAAGTYNFNLPTTAGTSGQVLASAGGVGAPMTWTTLATSATTDATNASNISSGTLGVARLPIVTVPYGGTGLTSVATNSLLYGNGAGNMSVLAPTNSAVLTTTGAGVPQWSTVASDTFTQYALLAGRAGGQSLGGGTAASENITIDSTTHATKGKVILAPNGGNVGIGTTSPGQMLTVNGTIESTVGGVKFPNGTIQTSAARLPLTDSIINPESSSSATYGDLGTIGPQVTVDISNAATVMVTITVQSTSPNTTTSCMAAVELTGTNSLLADDKYARIGSSTSASQSSATFVLTGLSGGNTTFTVKYKSSSGYICGFANRSIIVIPY